MGGKYSACQRPPQACPHQHSTPARSTSRFPWEELACAVISCVITSTTPGPATWVCRPDGKTSWRR
eukprot:12903552-Prorocentrum_lima.AAC.1